MKKLGSILHKKHKYGLAKQITAARVCTCAEKLINEIFSDYISNIKIKSYKNKVLYIEISNASLAQEIKMREEEILSKVKDKLEANIVRRISYKLNSF